MTECGGGAVIFKSLLQEELHRQMVCALQGEGAGRPRAGQGRRKRERCRVGLPPKGPCSFTLCSSMLAEFL